jgi:very-short-patch-repair endonuclease
MTISRKQEKNQIDGLRKRGIGVSKTEDKLADELRKRNVPYKRQERIGRYRVDFYIPQVNSHRYTRTLPREISAIRVGREKAGVS